LARDRADMPRLKAEFAAVLPRVEMAHPETYKEMRGALRTPLECLAMSTLPGATDPVASRARELMLFIAIAALAFMWLPAMNLININVSRIFERSSEIGVRKAFGASSRTLVGQFVLENVVLCMIGGLIALALSWLVLRGIGAIGLIPYGQLTLNVRLFVVALLLAAFFGVLSGVYPAWRMSRMHPVTALRGGSS
jgi:putative ABC transport system permease protein